MSELIDNNDDFSGFLETDALDEDFFSVDENEEEEGAKPGGDSKITPKPEGSKVEEEQEEEDNFFETAEENEEEEEEEEEEESKEDDDGKGSDVPSTEVFEGDSITTLNLLKEKGFLEYELEEGEDLTDERAGEILEDSIDGLFEERLEELFENVPDVVKQINKFVIEGGDINTFLQTVSIQNSTGLKQGMDLEDEANQELVIRHGLAEEGYDEEYITAQIEFLKDSKRMKKHSETHFKKWDTKRAADQKAILDSQAKRALADKTQRRELKNKVVTFLKETDEVTGFTVTKQDRKTLPTYMSDRTVKMQNGGQISAMQRDLMRVLNSPTGSVQIAKLLKAATEEGELNFDEIKKETETKVAKKVRENVRRNKKSIISQSGRSKRKSLADHFD